MVVAGTQRRRTRSPGPTGHRARPGDPYTAAPATGRPAVRRRRISRSPTKRPDPVEIACGRGRFWQDPSMQTKGDGLRAWVTGLDDRTLRELLMIPGMLAHIPGIATALNRQPPRLRRREILAARTWLSRTGAMPPRGDRATRDGLDAVPHGAVLRTSGGRAVGTRHGASARGAARGRIRARADNPVRPLRQSRRRRRLGRGPLGRPVGGRVDRRGTLQVRAGRRNVPPGCPDRGRIRRRRGNHRAGCHTRRKGRVVDPGDHRRATARVAPGAERAVRGTGPGAGGDTAAGPGGTGRSRPRRPCSWRNGGKFGPGSRTGSLSTAGSGPGKRVSPNSTRSCRSCGTSRQSVPRNCAG